MLTVGDSIGDAIDALLALMLVHTAEKIEGGLPPMLRSRMYFNIILDFGLGLVPFIGDLADAVYRANTRNCWLLEVYLTEKANAERTGHVTDPDLGIQMMPTKPKPTQAKPGHPPTGQPIVHQKPGQPSTGQSSTGQPSAQPKHGQKSTLVKPGPEPVRLQPGTLGALGYTNGKIRQPDVEMAMAWPRQDIGVMDAQRNTGRYGVGMPYDGRQMPWTKESMARSAVQYGVHTVIESRGNGLRQQQNPRRGGAISKEELAMSAIGYGLEAYSNRRR
jgi:hypothetical protein